MTVRHPAVTAHEIEIVLAVGEVQRIDDDLASSRSPRRVDITRSATEMGEPRMDASCSAVEFPWNVEGMKGGKVSPIGRRGSR